MVLLNSHLLFSDFVITGVGVADQLVECREHVVGSKRCVTIFLFSRLLRSQKFLCRLFMIAIETTFTVIDCIGDYNYYDDDSESYPTSVC